MFYYIVEYKFKGTGAADVVEIRTMPARKSSNGRKCKEGLCRSTSAWSVIAHGEYKSIHHARAAVAERFGLMKRRQVDDYAIVEVYTKA